MKKNVKLWFDPLVGQELDLLPVKAQDPQAKTFCLAVQDLCSGAGQIGQPFLQGLLSPEQAKKQLFTFLRPRGVPPTHHQAEPSWRPIVIRRKVIQQTRGEGGKENHRGVRRLSQPAADISLPTRPNLIPPPATRPQ